MIDLEVVQGEDYGEVLLDGHGRALGHDRVHVHVHEPPDDGRGRGRYWSSNDEKTDVRFAMAEGCWKIVVVDESKESVAVE